MPEKILLEIVTPERKILETEVDRVEVPGFSGELGILPGHTELISQLKPAGLLTYYLNEVKEEMAISDGFVEVKPDRIVVLADKAERPEDIDIARALELKETAERQLQKAMSDPDIDIARATTDLERASINIQLAEKARK
ncbi:MAG: F0F1 ATP synthase subunit epsilon [Blastocatellia bacterium]|nr:F0F1 ATP synthase subunit epsilon [Blastocatellia bacterium]